MHVRPHKAAIARDLALQCSRRMFCFKVIITTGGNARRNSAARVATWMFAECALPSVVVPGHTNSDVLNGLPCTFEHGVSLKSLSHSHHITNTPGPLQRITPEHSLTSCSQNSTPSRMASECSWWPDHCKHSPSIILHGSNHKILCTTLCYGVRHGSPLRLDR